MDSRHCFRLSFLISVPSIRRLQASLLQASASVLCMNPHTSNVAFRIRSDQHPIAPSPNCKPILRPTFCVRRLAGCFLLSFGKASTRGASPTAVSSRCLRPLDVRLLPFPAQAVTILDLVLTESMIATTRAFNVSGTESSERSCSRASTTSHLTRRV